MSRREPVEKFSLAIRKNLRDEWEAKKPGFEKQLSDLLGVSWTLDIDPKLVCAYAEEGYAKDSPGNMLSAYIDGALYQIKYFVSKHGDEGKNDLNTIASAHVITMDFDEHKKFTYCGCEVSPTGQLVILFAEKMLGTNIDHAVSVENLTKALNEAPDSAASSKAPMSFVARAGVRNDYEAEIKPSQDKLDKMFAKTITIEPRFEEAFEKLKAAKDADESWERNLGMYVKKYVEGLVWWLNSKKFGEDEMLQEGFNEAVEKGIVAFRIVDDGQLSSTYNDCVIEDGVLLLRTIPKYFGTNVDYAAEKLMDLL